MVMSLYRTLKTGTLKKRRDSSLGPPPETQQLQQQQQQLHQSKEQLNNCVVPNTASNTINSTTATTITGSSSNLNNNTTSEMVSRRKILSRSRDDLNLVDTVFVQEDEDTWHNKDKLFREHIQEVLDKWTQIDDEIWAKVIIFERNRRVAKAYARTPVLTINGSDDGFDGMRIGLCGFDNPMRDQKAEEVKRHIGQGVKLKMDDNGNILARRYAKSNVYVKGTGNLPTDETAIGNEVLKSPNQCLEFEKVMKIFDMKKFQSNVNRELSRAYPDRRRLETQCMSMLSFVKTESDILDCPIWILIINVVAMDMLKSKLPPVHRQFDIRNRPRIPVPDEDPYSNCNEVDSSGSSGFGASGIYGHIAREQQQIMLQSHYPPLRREKPPKLPPRDNHYGHHELHTGVMKPDYDEIDDDEIRVKLVSRSKSDKSKNNNNHQRKYGGDDLYYCGLRAKQTSQKFPAKEKLARKTSRANEDQQPIYVSSNRNLNRVPRDPAVKRRISHVDRHQPTFSSLYQLNQINDPRSSLYQRLHHHSYNMMSPNRNYNAGHSGMWHARSYESGIDSELIESPYQIYGRLPTTPSSRGGSRGYISSNSRMYIGDWE